MVIEMMGKIAVWNEGKRREEGEERTHNDDIVQSRSQRCITCFTTRAAIYLLPHATVACLANSCFLYNIFKKIKKVLSLSYSAIHTMIHRFHFHFTSHSPSFPSSPPSIFLLIPPPLTVA